MGLDYAFELVAPRRSADRLLRAVADHLVPDDAARLLACLPFDVARPFLNMGPASWGDEVGQACLSFLFPPDPDVRAYGDPIGREQVNGRVPVGCVYVSFKAGQRIALFSGTAATTDMSRLFAESPGVRRTWTSIAENTGALLLLLDDEQFDCNAVWPVQRRFAWPSGADGLGWGDERHYVAAVRAAGVEFADDADRPGDQGRP